MNERIQQLAREAGLLAHNPDGPPTKLEKFAELIVLECAVIVGSMEEPHQDIAKLIKQHFGVEE